MVVNLLTGTFQRNLDDKNRFAIPKPLREALGHPETSIMYLAPGTDGSLALYSEDGFSQLGSRLGEASPIGANVRAFSRLFYAQAQRVELDRHGRLRIPAGLLALAGCQSREIVLLGVRDHLEIWDRQRWEAYLAGTQPHYDQIAEQAFDPQSSPGSAPTTSSRPADTGDHFPPTYPR